MRARDRGALPVRPARSCQSAGVAACRDVYRLPLLVASVLLAQMHRAEPPLLPLTCLRPRRMTAMLQTEDLKINRERAMGVMEVAATAKTEGNGGGSSHNILACLLRDRIVDRLNQVWRADITCIPPGPAFSAVGILDPASRRCLLSACRTHGREFRVHHIDQASGGPNPSAIFNTGTAIAVRQRRLHQPAGELREPSVAAGSGCWSDTS